MNISKTNSPQGGMPEGVQAIAGAIAACLIGAGIFYAFLSGVENGGATAHAAGSVVSGPAPLWALALVGGVSIAVVSTLLFGFAHFDGMREGGPNRNAVRQVMTLVPRPIQWISVVLLACAIASGFAYTFLVGFTDGGATVRDTGSPVPHSALPWGLGMFAGILIAVWVLLVGYVYADARRRSMPAGLWAMIAVIVPNVIGFLLYFALRRPLLAFCSQCGQPVAAQHRFCPSCGQDRNSVPVALPKPRLSAQEPQIAKFNFVVAVPTFCMVIFLANAFSLYRKHDHTGGIVWLVAAAVCVGFSVYAGRSKSSRPG
jgi:hypothetical protein